MQSGAEPFLTSNVQHNNRTYPVHVQPDDTIEMVKRQIRDPHLELMHIQDLEALDAGILAGIIILDL
jgi:hypothetical protein